MIDMIKNFDENRGNIIYIQFNWHGRLQLSLPQPRSSNMHFEESLFIVVLTCRSVRLKNCNDDCLRINFHIASWLFKKILVNCCFSNAFELCEFPGILCHWCSNSSNYQCFVIRISAIRVLNIQSSHTVASRLEVLLWHGKLIESLIRLTIASRLTM